MLATQPELVRTLRSLASLGEKPSCLLRKLIQETSHTHLDGQVDRNLLVHYFAEAFCWQDGQGYPIFGWRLDGSGELQDRDIDTILCKRMAQTRELWAAHLD